MLWSTFFNDHCAEKINFLHLQYKVEWLFGSVAELGTGAGGAVIKFPPGVGAVIIDYGVRLRILTIFVKDLKKKFYGEKVLVAEECENRLFL